MHGLGGQGSIMQGSGEHEPIMGEQPGEDEQDDGGQGEGEQEEVPQGSLQEEGPQGSLQEEGPQGSLQEEGAQGSLQEEGPQEEGLQGSEQEELGEQILVKQGSGKHGRGIILGAQFLGGQGLPQLKGLDEQVKGGQDLRP